MAFRAPRPSVLNLTLALAMGRICGFHVFSWFWPIVPPTSRPGRAAALGGPAAFNQIRWAPPGRAVRRGVCRSRVFPFAVAPAMGRRHMSGFHVFANYSPHHHPTGLLRPWMARPRLSRRAGPRQGGNGAGGSVVSVFSWPRSCRLITHTSMQSGHLAILSERHRRPGNYPATATGGVPHAGRGAWAEA